MTAKPGSRAQNTLRKGSGPQIARMTRKWKAREVRARGRAFSIPKTWRTRSLEKAKGNGEKRS